MTRAWGKEEREKEKVHCLHDPTHTRILPPELAHALSFMKRRGNRKKQTAATITKKKDSKSKKKSNKKHVNGNYSSLREKSVTAGNAKLEKGRKSRSSRSTEHKVKPVPARLRCAKSFSFSEKRVFEL